MTPSLQSERAMTETPVPTLAQALDDLIAVQANLCNATGDRWHEVLRVRDKQFYALRNRLEAMDAVRLPCSERTDTNG